jgi:hypothetical protein
VALYLTLSGRTNRLLLALYLTVFLPELTGHGSSFNPFWHHGSLFNPFWRNQQADALKPHLTEFAGPSLYLTLHCTQSLNHIFLEMKLRGLVPNFHIHVSVSDLYNPTIGLLQQNRWTYPGNI